MNRFNAIYFLALVLTLQYICYVLALPNTFILVLEVIIAVQLITAWHQYNLSNASSIYAILALMLFRMLTLSQAGAPGLWGWRYLMIETPVLAALPALAMFLLHPIFYTKIQSNLAGATITPRQKTILLFLFLLFMLVLFSTLTSRNISRDGVDWIKRAQNPVWHQYLREPLTIGLYRAAYLGMDTLFPASRAYANAWSGIGFLSIISGLWTLYWFQRWFKITVHSRDEYISGLFLLLSSGGVMVLFFGHIEVYPIVLAGWMTTFYFAQRYINGDGSIIWPALWLAVSFILHLSTGWLFPAFFLLPFCKASNQKWIKDCAIMAATIAIIIIVFTLFLLMAGYGGSFQAMAARFHQTFNVGLDRAMFLPMQAWFHPHHLWDLFNEYFYISIPVVLLLPLALIKLDYKNWQRYAVYLIAFASYFIYSFTWNPDRGFPEDWDLFAPLGLPAILFINNSQQAQADITRAIYIISLGTLPFAIYQILYHHTVPLQPPGL